MRLLKQSTTYNLTVFMTDSADHVAGKTGLTLTITASKDGAAFASITPTVTELSSGWYKLALTTSHTDTLGDFALHVTATGADPTDVAMVIRANVLGDTLPTNVLQISGDTTAADNLEAAADGTGYNLGGGSIVAASVTGLTASNLDAAISTRATPAQVNTEVLDVFNVDTFAEPGQEAPAATASLVKKIGYLYKFLRNKVTSSTTEIKVFADDGTTVDQKSAHSDDGTTYTRPEFGAGP